MKLPELRGILQYVTRFRDKVFIIAINGEILESENFANILLDIAVLRSLNIKVVLVHGAAFQIQRAAEQRTLRRVSGGRGFEREPGLGIERLDRSRGRASAQVLDTALAEDDLNRGLGLRA